MKKRRSNSARVHRDYPFALTQEEEERKLPDPKDPLMHPGKRYKKYLKIQSV
jgi:hypothetical protein